jgi:hypothetical protein
VIVESLGRSLPAEALSGAAVEGRRDGDEIVGAVLAEVCALREVLSQQAVGVLVCAPLPGALRVAEVDRQPRGAPYVCRLRAWMAAMRSVSARSARARADSGWIDQW